MNQKGKFFKNLSAILLAVFFLSGTLSVSGQSCCAVQSMEDYQLLGSNSSFMKAHAEPLPFTFVSAAGGTAISFDAPDGKKANGFFIKAKKKTNQWLFVYQEWWGLNDYIKKQSETYYNDLNGDVNVLAVDLYDGKVAATREDAGKFMAEAKEPRMENIIKGAIGYSGKKSKIVSIGWCFGGGWSLRSALLEQKHAEGCIMYYGMPVKEVEKLKTLNCDVIGFFAGREKWINKDIVEAFDKNMTAAGNKLTYKIYDAEHAFANPSNPNFDKEATEETHNKAVAYMKMKYKL